jgi:NADPH:quinone reductase-like Zn-dependent oxidoreductase
MRAVVQDRYGSIDALEVREIETPRPADDEVLVRVRAASVHPDVWHVVTGRPHVLRLMGSGLRRPRNPVPGTDVAGDVVSVGAGATRFAPADEVFGETLRGFQWTNGGAFAEYAVVPEGNLARKPSNVTFEQAAAIPTSGLIVMANLAASGLPRRGDHVLVNGSGGGVGSIALQVAKAHGATVTGVDTAAKLPFIRSLGADRVIDYESEDFTEGTERFDLIVDVPGNHSFRQCRAVLAPDGAYVWIGHDGFGATAGRWWGNLPRGVGTIARSVISRQVPVSFKAPAKSKSMAALRDLVESGDLTTVVAAAYPLDDVVGALHHLERGTAQGRIVMTV